MDRQRIEGRYDLALLHIVTGLGHAIAAAERRGDLPVELRQHSLLDSGLAPHPWLRHWRESFVSEERELPRWLVKAELGQKAIDAFVAIQKGRAEYSHEVVKTACDLIPSLWDGAFGIDQGDDVAVEDQDLPWEAFWNRAYGWVIGQAPSELTEFLNQADDLQARRRLEAYFFRSGLWEHLPDRAQRALVNADREWLDGNMSRAESLLNELRVAAEELLQVRLWRPLSAWYEKQPHVGKEALVIAGLKAQEREGRSLGLPQFADLCGCSAMASYVAAMTLDLESRKFLTEELPAKLRKLQAARNEAEHDSGAFWSKERLGGPYFAMVADGDFAALPRLARVLPSSE